MNLRHSPQEFECKNTHSNRNCISVLFECEICSHILTDRLFYDLSGLNINKIHSIKSESHFTTLNLSKNDIRDISFLINNTYIKHLDISYNNILDFEPLFKMKSLSYLSVSSEQLEKIGSERLSYANIHVNLI
jgi:hypothetical protein